MSRLDDLAHKWLKDCESVDEAKDKVVLEQFINTLSEEVKIFVLERKPESSEEAGKLADDFQQARKFEKEEVRTVDGSTTRRSEIVLVVESQDILLGTVR